MHTTQPKGNPQYIWYLSHLSKCRASSYRKVAQEKEKDLLTKHSLKDIISGVAMKDALNKVREFMELSGQEVGAALPEQGGAIRLLRRQLLMEELFEYRNAEIMGDVEKIADALGDMVYVICGTALAYGIPLDRVFKEIHRSNMTKERVADGGKAAKGPNYSPPNIKACLEYPLQNSKAQYPCQAVAKE